MKARDRISMLMLCKHCPKTTINRYDRRAEGQTCRVRFKDILKFCFFFNCKISFLECFDDDKIKY